MFKNKQSNKLVNIIGLILVLMAIGIAYMGKVVDFEMITAPFNNIVDEMFEGTIIGDRIDEARTRELERQIKRELAIANGEIDADPLSKFPYLSKAQQYYLSFQAFITKMESSIEQIDNYFLIVVAILLLFTIKAFVALVPVSATCLISAVLFPFPAAVAINFAGYSIILTIKYFWGNKIGEGGISKLMKHSQVLWKYIQDEENGYGTGNPVLLFTLRLVPTVPMNPISQMYGKMGYNYYKFMFLSLLGYSLKIVSFTALGSNIGNPFSSSFVVPLVIILFVSGISILALSFILSYRQKQEAKKKLKDGLELEDAS